MDISQKVGWNLYSTVVAVGAAAVTKKAVESAWEFVTGEEPPEPNDPDVPTGQAIAWVVAVAVGVGLSQVLINRFAAKRWSAFTGEGQSSRPVNLRF